MSEQNKITIKYQNEFKNHISHITTLNMYYIIDSNIYPNNKYVTDNKYYTLEEYNQIMNGGKKIKYGKGYKSNIFTIEPNIRNYLYNIIKHIIAELNLIDEDYFDELKEKLDETMDANKSKNSKLNKDNLICAIIDEYIICEDETKVPLFSIFGKLNISKRLNDIFTEDDIIPEKIEDSDNPTITDLIINGIKSVFDEDTCEWMYSISNMIFRLFGLISCYMSKKMFHCSKITSNDFRFIMELIFDRYYISNEYSLIDELFPLPIKKSKTAKNKDGDSETPKKKITKKDINIF